MATAVRPTTTDDDVMLEQSPAPPVGAVAPAPPRKLGLLRRLRKKGGRKAKKENATPNEDNQKNEQLIKDGEEMKHVRFPAQQALKKKSTAAATDEMETAAPPARQAAYGGPPRYDWIDIETAAAVKVQSIARRNLTMERLEQEEGITTAAIRNRNRRRQARMESRGASSSADVPNLFACCGIGLAFGDATEEDYEVTRAHQREEYFQRKQEKEQREAELREAFQKAEAQKKAARTSNVQEAYEVIE